MRKRVMVQKDMQIVEPSEFKIITKKWFLENSIRVSDLINPETRKWRIELMRELFYKGYRSNTKYSTMSTTSPSYYYI